MVEKIENPWNNYSWVPKEHANTDEPLPNPVGTDQTINPNSPNGPGTDSGDGPAPIPAHRSIHGVHDAVQWGSEN